MSYRRSRERTFRDDRQRRPASPVRGENPRVFLGGITSNENDADIKDKFREFGRITDIALKDGYGFIEFENGE